MNSGKTFDSQIIKGIIGFFILLNLERFQKMKGVVIFGVIFWGSLSASKNLVGFSDLRYLCA
jgi:hypothetical protein